MLTTTPSETLPPAVTAPCRVCGNLFLSTAVRCARCGTPGHSRPLEQSEATWLDYCLATLFAILALAVALPTTLFFSRHILNVRLTSAALAAAISISAFNGWLIGLPVIATLWRWRDRVQDGHHQHGIALREYWQMQGLCLLPIAMVGLFVGSIWLWFFFW